MADVPPDPNTGASGTEVATIHALRSLGHSITPLWRDSFPHRIFHGNMHYLLELPLAMESAAKRACLSETFDAVVMNQPHCYRAARWLTGLPARPLAIHKSHGLETLVNQVRRQWALSFSTKPQSALRKLLSQGMEHLLERHTRLAARFCDGHIVSASSCKNHLMETFAVSSRRIATIPQAAPSDFLESPPSGWSEARERKLLHVGQFAEIKGCTLLAKAWNLLSARDNRLELTWVCASEHHNQAAGLLTPTARSRTAFLPWMPRTALREVYDRHGIFLFPSYFEGFGKVFLEAMARGLCVVSTAQGGAKDILREGETGLLTPVGDAEALTEAVWLATRADGPAAAIGPRAAASARQFTWQRTAREILASLERWRKECQETAKSH
jgi:glycosyltransferase involved in cell wall biosynthesis